MDLEKLGKVRADNEDAYGRKLSSSLLKNGSPDKKKRITTQRERENVEIKQQEKQTEEEFRDQIFRTSVVKADDNGSLL